MIKFRGLQIDDAPKLFELRNDEYGKKMYLGNIQPNSIEQERIWIESLRKNGSENLVFGILFEEELVGFYQLKRINYVSKNAEYAILLDKKFRGKSIGTKVTKLALEYAFYQLNLGKIYLYVLNINVIAKKIYTRLGFIERGLLKKHYFVQNEYLDLCYMEIFKEDFENTKAEINNKNIFQ